jgi:hypothetical protein
MMWCLPSLPTGRIGRLVVLNSSLPPHPLLTELSIANAGRNLDGCSGHCGALDVRETSTNLMVCCVPV